MEDHKKSARRKAVHRKKVRKKSGSAAVNNSGTAEKDSGTSEKHADAAEKHADAAEKKKIREYAQAYKDYAKLLKNHHDEMRKIYSEIGSDCFRVYDRELSVFPFAVEKYGRTVIISEDPADQLNNDSREKIDWDRIADITARMTYTEPADVICLPSPSFQTSFQASDPVSDLASETASDPASETVSGDAAGEIEVEETGISYLVDGRAGFFRSSLAETVLRNLIRSEVRGKRVLTAGDSSGLYSLFAAAGGATETVSLVPSREILAYTENMLKRNNLSVSVHKLLTDAEGKSDEAEKSDEAGDRWEKQNFYHMVILDADTAAQDEDSFFRKTARLHTLVAENGSLLICARKGMSAKQTAKAVTEIIQEDEASEAMNLTQELVPPGFTKKRFPLQIWLIRKKSISSGKKRSRTRK